MRASLFRALVFSFFIGVFSSVAAELEETAKNRRSIERIEQLAYEIERNIRFSQASSQDLARIESYLERAVELMNDDSGDTYRECVDFAYRAYRRGMTDSRALDRAQERCGEVADIEVLEFLYDAFSRGLASTQAMDRAAFESGHKVAGKIKMIEFAYDKYSRGLASVQAATRAAQAVHQVSTSNGLSCFERYYPIYSRNHASVQAMDRTASSCQSR